MSILLRRIKAAWTSITRPRGPLPGPTHAQGAVYHVVDSEMTFEKVMVQEIDSLNSLNLPIQEHRERLAELKMKYLEIAIAHGWLIKQ